MRALSRSLALLMGVAALCGGCRDEEEPPLALVSGTYAQELDANSSNTWSSPHPHANNVQKKVTVDRQANQVRFQYVRDGKRIDERWRIVRTETR